MIRRLARPWVLWVIFASALLVVGPMDYASELEIEAEEKLARPLRIRLLENSTRAADINDCLRAGVADPVLTVNTTRDGIRWWVRRWCLEPKPQEEK